ncbi:MAG: DUF4157 domain-containing protein [Bacteroidota bacterium]
MQLKAIQDMANKSPQAKQVAQLQAMADNHSAQHQQPIQKKGNKTGLPDNLKTGIENLSGYSMDDVRVHYNSDKPAQLQAHAYAQGTDIHLASGQEKHLPHEAWHVVQQKQGRVKPSMQMKGEININNDADLEKEADLMGKKSMQTSSENQVINPIDLKGLTTNVVQRVVHINDAIISDEQIRSAVEMIRTLNAIVNVQGSEMTMNVAIPNGKQILETMNRDREIYNFLNVIDLISFLKNIQTQSDIKRGYKKNAQRWYDHPDSEGSFEMKAGDPLFDRLAAEVIQNHQQNPYTTDALHETGSIMGGFMSGDYIRMLGGFLEGATYTGRTATDRPDIKITRIIMYKNPRLLREYRVAREEMKIRNQELNERHLYSGHGEAGLNFITSQGHDPSFGQYSWVKGHGAHGRGAYFTDRVDKALSYSRAGQTAGEERSFLRQDVLLGNTREYTQKGLYRHSHHNEMVRSDRNTRNKNRTEGVDTAGTTGVDSLLGRASTTSGASLLGTWWHGKQFDSDEFMVRNADQIYVKFRIFYEIT